MINDHSLIISRRFVGYRALYFNGKMVRMGKFASSVVGLLVVLLVVFLVVFCLFFWLFFWLLLQCYRQLDGRQLCLGVRSWGLCYGYVMTRVAMYHSRRDFDINKR